MFVCRGGFHICCRRRYFEQAKTISRNYRGAGRTLILIALGLAVLSACSPRYDWREIQPAGAGLTANFPGRVQEATRTVDLEGRRLQMTMYTTRVEQVSFAIGIAETPPSAEQDDKTTRAELLASLRTAMLHNIGGTVLREQGARLMRAGYTAAPIEASDVEASGLVAGKPVRLFARFAEYPDAIHRNGGGLGNGSIIELLVLGPEAELGRSSGRQAVETFMTSVKIY